MGCQRIYSGEEKIHQPHEFLLLTVACLTRSILSVYCFGKNTFAAGAELVITVWQTRSVLRHVLISGERVNALSGSADQCLSSHPYDC